MGEGGGGKEMRGLGEGSGAYMTPSSWGSGKEGILFRRRAAFPLTRRTASFWKRWAMATSSSSPVCLALAAPIFLTF